MKRQVRRLLAEGKITSYGKGELAIKLKDMEFEEDEAIVAADNCEDVYSATKFLHQECELCASRMNVKEVGKISSGIPHVTHELDSSDIIVKRRKNDDFK